MTTADSRATVFISHISEERAVALKLQTIIQNAFSNAFQVFVSSDPVSLGGGEMWFSYILDNLAKAKVVLVLISSESADEPWINFEAGFGKGQKSIIIPIACRGLSFDSLAYPLKGFQGYDLSALKVILNEISRHMGASLHDIDFSTELEELNKIQCELPAKKLALELEAIRKYPLWELHFFIVNNGNCDVHPLEITIWIPSDILGCSFDPSVDRAILEVRNTSINNIGFKEITYRNDRDPTTHNRFSTTEPLVQCLSPGRRVRLQHIFPEVRYPLTENELKIPIRYRILAKNTKPVERAITLEDKLTIPKP